jgi:PAS domain-containing protein/DNA-binding CsgD family transcriptional regulator
VQTNLFRNPTRWECAINPNGDGYWDNLSIFSKLSIGILSLSPNGNILECNEAAAENIGFAPEALRQLTIDKIFPLLEPDSWQFFWRDLQNRDHLESLGCLVDIQHQNIPARIIWFSCRSKSKRLCFMMIFKMVGHLPALSDISIYKHLLIRLLNTNEYSTMTLDENNHVCSLNDESCQLLNVNRSDIQGNNVVDFLPEALTNRFLKKKQQSVKSMSPSIFSQSVAGFGFSSARMANEIALLPFVDPITSSKNIIVIILHAGVPMGSPMIQRPDRSMLALLPSMPFAINLETFLNSLPAVAFITDAQSCLLWANTLFCELLDANQAELIRKPLSEVIGRPDVAEKWRKEDMYIVRTRQSLFEIVEWDTHYRGTRSRMLKFPLFDEHGEVQAIVGLSIRIEEQKESAEAMTNSDNLLKSLSPMLKDIQKSIDILLDQGAQNSKLRPQSQTNDIRDLVLPYIESLNKTFLKKDQKQYLGLIEENINRLSDPITAKISSPVFRLSPNQVKVAQLIRDGKTNKEIAELLHLSKSTILTHRHNIRVKLNLKKKKINLRSYLQSLVK